MWIWLWRWHTLPKRSITFLLLSELTKIQSRGFIIDTAKKKHLPIANYMIYYYKNNFQRQLVMGYRTNFLMYYVLLWIIRWWSFSLIEALRNCSKPCRQMQKKLLHSTLCMSTYLAKGQTKTVMLTKIWEIFSTRCRQKQYNNSNIHHERANSIHCKYKVCERISTMENMIVVM